VASASLKWPIWMHQDLLNKLRTRMLLVRIQVKQVKDLSDGACELLECQGTRVPSLAFHRPFTGPSHAFNSVAGLERIDSC
jgi:hypothetical protein